MKQEYKAPWLIALRSGEYKQGREKLKDSGKYCCLGVLLEVTKIDNGGFVCSLMPATRGEFGITIRETHCLTDMNDVSQDNFNAIADYIEEHL